MIKLFLTLVFFLGIIFLPGCNEEEDENNAVKAHLVITELSDKDNLRIKLIIEDDDSKTNEGGIRGFIESADYTIINSSDQFSLKILSQTVEITKKDSNYQATVFSEVEITKNSVPISDLTQFSGKEQLKITGSILEYTFNLTGTLTFKNADSEDNTDGDITIPETDPIVEVVDNNRIELISTSFSGPDKVEMIFSLTGDPDSVTDDELRETFSNGLLDVSFENLNINHTHGSSFINLERKTDEVIINVLADAEFTDGANPVASMKELLDKTDMTFTAIFRGDNLQFSNSFTTISYNDTAFSAKTNIFAAGYDEVSGASIPSRKGTYPAGYSVAGKRYAFFSGSGSVDYGGPVNSLDGDNRTDSETSFIFTSDQKEYFYTTEVQHASGVFKIGYAACVFLGQNPKTYNERLADGDVTLRSYTDFTSFEDYDFIGTLEDIQLHEVFYIGDGKGRDGYFQKFAIPEGAEKIYCGITDLIDKYDNNTVTGLSFDIYAY